ncbi:hypothetical protein OJ996_26215 [Luteolibacter sp. GHJ8]|uniref:DUF3592 domain-containing protein n=1 Tax=Luteolibacter rhizosphaerae TaxID=2989719 RepID=A0ABT3GBV6_9BACT|nr:hypothetical protein [Luteolibacter rhizosphaerae]MCW1917109.1 hypothetical protein [Luteolibacter rhizosphaerae]
MPLRPTAFFYLGLLPVIILLWAWADSTRAITSWEYEINKHRYRSFELWNSQIVIKNFRPLDESYGKKLPAYGRFYRWVPGDLGFRDPMPLFPSPFGETKEPSWVIVTGVQRAHLPFWLILACYLPPWLGLSYYYARRRIKTHLTRPRTGLSTDH